MLPDLGAVAWAALAIGALTIGVSKTGLPGANTLGIALFASVLPAKESTGAMLLLLIVGDALALWLYRRHADWRALVRLAPSVIVGLLAGVVFLALADDAWVRRTIGIVLLGLIALTLWRRRASAERVGSGAGARALYGSLGGFTTMVANAGGPVMSMYFLASRFSMEAFLGTAAWFFAIVNVTKVPFSIGLGLITPTTLAMDALLVVPVLVGAAIGRWAVTRLSQRLFDAIVIGLTVVGALYLLV
ncbi:sulfite exporter TauE/SafE family protein [Microbacterium excoecariae]|uniref:sulfite exporter TauE/SafE family protein n=1 Tax=Microbacterium excoecariae TaxID=2715210 RepID=UPI0030B889D6|nr:sulfite exporter TauE/SafE family protein [Microbacterium excoecariae]